MGKHGFMWIPKNSKAMKHRKNDQKNSKINHEV
jgi:hypothetical protein